MSRMMPTSRQRDRASAGCERTASRGGFTLIELLVVLAVTLTLVGIGVPAYYAHLRRGRVVQTRMLVETLTGAVASYGQQSWSVFDQATGRHRQYGLWDWNQDGLLDGQPERESPGIESSGHVDHALFASGYRGIIAMTGVALAKSRVDAQGRPLDAWQRPLRIARAAGVYGQGTVGIWSTGPDGKDGPLGSPEAADNITSWQVKR